MERPRDTKRYVARNNLTFSRLDTHTTQAFQTAVALACFQAKQEGSPIPELTDDHLRQVVNMSHNFKSYVKAVRGKEEDYAYAAGVRNDTTRSSGGSEERLRSMENPNF